MIDKLFREYLGVSERVRKTRLALETYTNRRADILLLINESGVSISEISNRTELTQKQVANMIILATKNRIQLRESYQANMRNSLNEHGPSAEALE